MQMVRTVRVHAPTNYPVPSRSRPIQMILTQRHRLTLNTIRWDMVAYLN